MWSILTVGEGSSLMVRKSAERGGEGAEVILSVGGEGDGIFWSGGGAVWGVRTSPVNRPAVSEELPDLEQYLKLF
jgi:hypothetical protein